MSRTPVLDATVSRMAQLALTTGESLPDTITPDEAATAYLLSFTENGGRLSQLAQSLGVSRFLLQRWIWGNPERKQAYARARTEGADALVDEGGDLLDGATKDTIAVANARAGWRKWLASKYDPTTYGDTQPTTVQVGSLHYHAALSRPTQVTLSALPPVTVPTLTPPPEHSPKPPLNGSHQGAGGRGYPTETQVVRIGETEVGVLPPDSSPAPVKASEG